MECLCKNDNMKHEMKRNIDTALHKLQRYYLGILFEGRGGLRKIYSKKKNIHDLICKMLTIAVWNPKTWYFKEIMTILQFFLIHITELLICYDLKCENDMPSILIKFIKQTTIRTLKSKKEKNPAPKSISLYFTIATFLWNGRNWKTLKSSIISLKH